LRIQRPVQNCINDSSINVEIKMSPLISNIKNPLATRSLAKIKTGISLILTITLFEPYEFQLISAHICFGYLRHSIRGSRNLTYYRFKHISPNIQINITIEPFVVLLKRVSITPERKIIFFPSEHLPLLI